MKRLAVVLGLGLALGSCNPTRPDQAGEIMNENYNIKEVQFKGHLYNIFSMDRGGSLSHSPNCKCNKSETKLTKR